MYPVSLEEIERLARNHGFAVEKVHQAADQQGRPEVSWTWVALRLPDDGTGALPLLRHVILNDQKSATYKLGLLRALCRAADGSAGLVDETNEDFVQVPLGLVALNWLRLYLPLVREGLPQTPTNIGAEGLGFAKEGFKQLLADTSAADLRIGAAFSTDRAKAVHAAIRELELAKTFAAWVEKSGDWKLMAPVPFSLVCFRYAKPGLSDEQLDARNEAIMHAVNAGGDVFLSDTKLGGRFILRLAIGNIRTEERHVALAWRRPREAGALSSLSR